MYFGGETYAATLLWLGVMAALELDASQKDSSFNEVGAVEPVVYLKPWIAVTWAVVTPASL